MLLIVSLILLVAMCLVLVMAIKGPTVYDRILAANAFGNKTVALIAVLSFMIDDSGFLDIALIYALINFISTIALLKYFKYHSFGKE